MFTTYKYQNDNDLNIAFAPFANRMAYCEIPKIVITQNSVSNAEDR